MIESSENIWNYWRKPNHLVCITTNGSIKKNGSAVMGAGCALEATQKIKDIARMLGNYLVERGNMPGFLPGKLPLIIFPVKNNWWEPADKKLIQISVNWLKEYADRLGVSTFHLPCPGCGRGRLRWEDVKPLVEILPDNVLVHRRREELNES